MLLRRALPLTFLAASGVVLAGCASTSGEGAESAPIVASTNVYASIAQALVGDAAEVTAVIDDATQDPHSYEASARDRLTVQGATLVIENGGGYDPFMDDLLGGDAVVIEAVSFSHDYPGAESEEEAHAEDEHAGETEEEHAEHAEHAEDEHAEEPADEHAEHAHIEGFNEHVWYDPHTMVDLVEGLAEEIEHELPDLVDAEALAANRDALIADLEALEARLESLSATHEGEGVFLTEPIGGYLAAAAGLADVTPEGFAESVEEGQDVAPATLLDATRVIESGEVAVVLANAQTGGAETDRVIETAEAAGVPVVELSELLADDQTYIEWMTANVDALEQALSS
ncbi:zinc ABC transporter solute-binding protein [Microbacterium sp. MEC084]|uniref:metal ABC transporter solute-binding protein, Zn/Mn family n=1 Tax=Microbacterium sp. MEC084 TaxID=1963027 RepID=UPI00106F4FB3|nr:zinc ABC transporter substrate-binding protein [Microbacterium sp. MEC084]MCD1267962.1 zinc ABC transporter solute-binding protein [Microbacterium sp. MEC084]